MQDHPPSNTTWYFVFGSAEKSSLCTQFCRQNDFIYFHSPPLESLKPDLPKSAIIEGTLDLLHSAQKIKPQISIIMIGTSPTPEQKQLITQYQKIGNLKKCTPKSYKQFCKLLYPNLIFIYGPQSQQNNKIANKLTQITGYQFSPLLSNANSFITNIDKNHNFIINSFFNTPQELRIIQQYFNIKIIHLKYNRVDLPNHSTYFDQQFTMSTSLKNKSYYIPINATQTQDQILLKIGEKLCPKLIYAIANTESQLQYLQQYANQTSTLTLNINQIITINQRKNLPSLQSPQSKLSYLSSIFYKDFTHKQIIICNFPSTLPDIHSLQKLNRKISIFVDLVNKDIYQYSENYSIPIYFLQTQRWIRPNTKYSLLEQLKPKIHYWLVCGASGSGRTTVGKYLSNQFNYKLIQFESYLATVKQKLLGQDDGQQVPLKKIIDYFYQLFSNDRNNIYIIDGLPYEKKQLEDWIKIIGAPHIINLEVQQNQQIKRLRKKAQSDLNAQITQEQLLKAKENTEKNKSLVDKIISIQPSSQVYKINYNQPQIIAQQSINKLLKPKIFLISTNPTTLYQNISLKYELGYINLSSHKLRSCTSLLKSINNKNIILNNYNQDQFRNASEDIFWIQKNLGQIKYLSLWKEQQKQSQQQIMELQKPQPPQKPKPPQGQSSEQKPPQQPPPEPQEDNEGEATKKKFDIYSYEWTKPGNYKNLTQWFFKSKKNITQIKGQPQQCFTNFSQILQSINSDPSSHIYYFNVCQQ